MNCYFSYYKVRHWSDNETEKNIKKNKTIALFLFENNLSVRYDFSTLNKR